MISGRPAPSSPVEEFPRSLDVLRYLRHQLVHTFEPPFVADPFGEAHPKLDAGIGCTTDVPTEAIPYGMAYNAVMLNHLKSQRADD